MKSNPLCYLFELQVIQDLSFKFVLIRVVGDDLTASEVPNKTADQIDHHGLHPNSENMSKYSLECSEDGRFKIREELSEDETGDAHSFTLEKNPISCNSATCSVLCPDCPKMSGCVHQFTCDCKAFTSR